MKIIFTIPLLCGLVHLGFSQNFGIDQPSPLTKLHVNYTSSGGLTGTTAYGGLHLEQVTGNDGFVGITTDATSSGTQGGILFQGSGAYGTKIHFMTTSSYAAGMSNRMTLDHLGNLGIGITSPGARLEVAGQIKITGGSPAAGRVLTCDANGLATWAVPTGADNLGNHTATQDLDMSTSNINLSGNNQIIFSNTNTTNLLKLQLWGGYGLGINGSTLFYAANGNHSWRDSGGATERMRLTTASPTAVLDLDGYLQHNAVLKVNGGAETIWEASNRKYIIEAGPSVVGIVQSLNSSIVDDLCKDKDGCSVIIQMINWDTGQPGNVASRTHHLFMSETNRWWRFAENDYAGLDANGGNHEINNWDCYFGDSETSTNTSNGRSDSGNGFGLLNCKGCDYSDANVTCRVVIED